MKQRIVLSGVNLSEMGPLSIYQDALASLAAEHSGRFEIVALVHRRDLFSTPNVTYLEIPTVKASWLRRLRFEYWSLRKLSSQLNPVLWLSMHDMTPNVTASVRAVYCHNPAPFYRFRFADGLADWKFALFTLLYRFLYRINIHANDFVIVQQQWIREEFQRLYNLQNVVVAYPTVVLPRTTPVAGNRSQVYKFFFPAYPRVFKNIEVCLEAARSLERRNFSCFELWLTFDGSANGYAAGLCKRFSDVRSIRWLGLLQRSRIFELYAQADCLLFPSMLETWGLPITEFRNFAKPIIAADLPYARETAGGYEQTAFFDPEKPEELADLMQRAASGEAVFRQTEAIGVEEPFAPNWSKLWSILLGDEHSAVTLGEQAARGHLPGE